MAERLQAIGYQAHGVAGVGDPFYHDSGTSDRLAIGFDSDGDKRSAGNHSLRARQCVSCCATQDALPIAGVSLRDRLAGCVVPACLAHVVCSASLVV